MPSLVWYGIKHQLNTYGLLATVYCDRVLVNTWRYDRVYTRVCQRYLQASDVSRQCHSILADYLLGRWAGVGKPIARPGNGMMTSGEGPDRYVPTQPLMFECAHPSDLPRLVHKHTHTHTHARTHAQTRTLTCSVRYRDAFI